MVSPPTLSPEQLFCLEGCRSYEQYFHMRQNFESGGNERQSCTFCHLDRNINRVEWEDDRVMAWHVPPQFMRKELKVHYLIVPKRHTRFIHELTDAETLSMQQARRVMARKYHYLGGLTHTREGLMFLNSGTVPHLHENVFEVDTTYIETRARRLDWGNDPERVEVRVPVYKDPRDRKKNQDRAASFAVRYVAGEVP